MEKNVHNSLVDQGFPVPYVHYSCMDQGYFGNQFLIMDFLPGEILPLVFGKDTAIVLGKTHAALHDANSSRLSEDMIANGFEERQNNIEGKLDRLLKASEYLPWLEDICRWLVENRPSECEYPSICHGDFHPGNLLAKDSAVSAILDWSCCQIGDPAMDVASTMVVFNAATKHLIPSFNSIIETQKYLEAYKNERDLNEQHIEFYQVLGCVIALFAGTKGVLVWTQTPIQNELLHIIHKFSKIRVEVPG
jgi:aminoglycoside phosphotransferase (APT) family kinase protein